jgi:hypothetical protein
MGFNDLKKFVRGEGGGASVSITNPSTTFGEVQVAEAEPVAQGDFVYGINNQVFTSGSFAGSSVTFADSMVELNSGTNSSGSAVVQLRFLTLLILEMHNLLGSEMPKADIL